MRRRLAVLPALVSALLLTALLVGSVRAGDPVTFNLTKGGPTTVVAGTDMTYTLSVTNTSAVPAVNVTVADQVPAGLSVGTITLGDFDSSIVNPGPIVVLFKASLGVGETATGTFVVHVDSSLAGTQIINTATGQAVNSGLVQVTLATDVVAAPPSVAASLNDAAMTPPSPSTPLATLGFGLLLISSLGVLLVANARSRSR
jgi:uncharacterized repeat protein (TIGR01451 family)